MSVIELFSIGQAWAAPSAAEYHAPSFHQIWFPLGNFLIYAYIIRRFAVPLVRDFLRSRRQEVLTAIQGAAERKQRAATTLQHYKNLLANLDGEVKAIQDSLRAEGEREKSKMLQEAERVAGKIIEDSVFVGEQEIKIARQNVREQIANDAAASAKELIKRHLSIDDQGHLAADFMSRLREIR